MQRSKSGISDLNIFSFEIILVNRVSMNIFEILISIGLAIGDTQRNNDSQP